MNRIEIEKNRLDLSYQRNLQLINITLLVGAGSFITYLVAMIVDRTKLFEYTVVLVVLAAITIISYKKLSDNLRKVSEKLKNLIK